ncbi:MAG: hypothetical protein NTY08_14085, partial [Proteobacteria bacterium]|nr:hypothetical protein [Pseudomonadota bacterium]
MSHSKQKSRYTKRALLGARLYVFSLAFAASSISVSQAYAAPFSVAYSGRLTQATGAPVDGPVDVSVKFWNAAVSGSTLTAPVEFTAVDLNSGIFSLPLELSAEQVQQIFGDVSGPVFIEITAAGKTYPRQQYSFVPYALRIPVDGKTLAFDSNGNLGLSLTSLPASNQFLTKNSSGELIWGTPAVTAGTSGTLSLPNVGTAATYVKVVTDAQGRVTQGLSLSAADITGALGQSLTTAVVAESGTNLYYTDARARGVISANAPLSYGISSGQISLAQASGTASGYLSSSDWMTFNTKQNALGFTPLNKAGDSMSGALNMAGSDLTNSGQISMSASKTLLLSNNSADPSGLTAGDKGKTWFNASTNQIKYWDGSSAQALGVSGAGLTNLNGLTASTQTFATGTSGSSPAFSSSGSVHTLNIPLASAAGVTGGALSNSDYTSFSSKLGSVAAGTGVAVSTASGTATVSLSSVGTAGTYMKVQTNAQGQVISGSALSSSDIPNLDASKITTGQLSVANGGTGIGSFNSNGVLIGNGTGNLVSTTTPSSDQILRVPSAGGQPSFGAIDLSKSASVGGILPGANGGTGVNSTATFPTSGVVVTRDATETLTNKTLSAATINGASFIGGSTTINTIGTVNSGAHTAAGNVTILGNSTTANKLVLNDKGSTNSVALKAPDTLASSMTLELPSSSGSNGQVLATNGSGTLSWVSTAVGSVTNVTGTAPISVATDTSTPVISMAQANGSTNGYLSSSDWTTFNSKQSSGSYITGLTGDVTASGAGSASATLAAVAIAGTSTKVTYDVKGRVTFGTSLTSSDIPPISAALITSGTLTVANGGTGANLSTTGGTGQYVKQTTSGGSVTVGSIAAGDITSSLGYTPLNKAGDTLTGALNLGANDITNAGNIQMAASKTLALSTNSTDPSGLAAGDVGKTWFNSTSNQIKYWNGSAAVALGAAGSGLSNINGQTGSTQTLVVPGTSGTAPAWSSTSNAHTLNIPLASTASVTAGLISNSDYNTFNGKVGGVTSGIGVTVSTTGNIATVNLTTAGTSGNYSKVTTDAYGRVTSGTSLAAADIPPLNAAIITSGTLAAANGGTGVNSTATFPTSGVVVTVAATETLTNKTLTAATINGASSISGATTISTTGTAATGALTAASVSSQGNVTILGNSTTANKLVLNDKGSTNSVALKAPDTLASSLAWELPSTNGSSGQVLSTNGSGTLSWVSAAIGSVTNVTGTAPISVATGTSTPVISMPQANGTTNGYLSSADWTTFNTKQASGNYITALTGDITLSGFTSGSAAATLATVATAGTATKVTYDAKGRVNSGTSLTAADIPAHSAALISSGTLAVANGGTGVSSTTASSVFAGPTSGSGAPSFRTLVAGDYPAMIGANGSTAGTAGAVPGPLAADNVKFLRGDGTWAAPTAAAAGATNQIQYNSSGALTGNSNFVYSGGNVGIGTTTPSDLLEVNNQSAGGLTAIRVNNPSLTANSDEGLSFYRGTGKRVEFYNRWTGSSELTVLNNINSWPLALQTSGGNVGIGTTSPAFNLDVSGSSATSNGVGIRIFNSNASNTNGWWLGTGG